jgi:carbonic anhydrase/acetyltransferase-like protein (isoleucine patch superfamily)
VGEVSMGDDCSIWFNAVVRGDVHFIQMGNRVNVQDGAVITVPTKNTRPASATMFPSVTWHWCMDVRYTMMC